MEGPVCGFLVTHIYAGEGSNRNWPLPQKTGDADYLAALDEALAVVRDFGPRYLVVSFA